MSLRINTFTMRVQILDDNNEVSGQPITLIGRECWTMRKLLDAGSRGVSSLDNIGPRLAHYIFKLRSYGFAIETVHEKNGGDFPGSHSNLQILSDVSKVAA